MKKKRFSESQRIAIVKSYEEGNTTVDALCQEHQISPATFYKWKADLSAQSTEDKKRLRELELENARLKKMYVELQLEKDVISEALNLAKKYVARRKNTKS